jgi:type 1 glutamine amidotransferase
MDHPATCLLNDTSWFVTDEFYSFDSNPRDCAKVLISIDENSYNVDDNQWFPDVKQRMGDHPMVWYKEFEGGRVFHTALGHSAECYNDPLYTTHLSGAILWACGLDN